MSDQHAENLPPEASPRRAAATKEERRLLLTTKQRRLGERLAELGIFSVATVSILAIFLIFVFVFRESAPIFLGSPVDDDATRPSGGAVTGTAPADTQEVYGGDAPSVGAPEFDTTEVYNPTTGAPPIAGLDTAGVPDDTGRTAAAIATPEGIDRGDYPTLEHDAPVKLSYLWYDVWQPNSDHPAYGILPIIIGTIKTTFVALAIATPLGILAALYTAFFAPLWVREYLKPIIELLAAFPSVVVGFFCLMTVASVVQAVFGNEIRLNAVVGGIGLSIAVIPIIFTITDDALRAVPRSLREAALALGASEWQAAYQVMLPAATPGVVAAVLLGLGRAFGETMIALMATGNGQVMSWDLFVSVRTFAATIGAEMGEVVTGSPHYQVLFFLGVLLFTFSFVINFVTEFYVKKRLIKRFRGGE